MVYSFGINYNSKFSSEKINDLKSMKYTVVCERILEACFREGKCLFMFWNIVPNFFTQRF